ncbi:MAG: DUF4124 domain-containing protein [Cellvibrionaceae bacterium]
MNINMEFRKPLRNLYFCFGLFFPVLLFSFDTTAEIYKWTDEKGKVHFSDKPPENKKAEDITESVKNTNIDASQNEHSKLNKIFAKETEGEKQLRLRKAKEQKKQKVEIEKRCAKAKKDLKFLREKRFFTLDENGKENTMTEKQRNELTSKYSQLIKKNCK